MLTTAQINIELTHIIQKIESSPTILTLPKFLAALLSSKHPQHQPVKLALKTHTNLIPFLDILLQTDTEGAVMEWIIKKAQHICTKEITSTSAAATGLHFNASNARAEEITDFRLDAIAEKYERVAPHTWSLVQSLLDSNQDAWRRVKPTRTTVTYSERHEVQEDATTILGDVLNTDSVEDQCSPRAMGSSRRLLSRARSYSVR